MTNTDHIHRIQKGKFSVEIQNRIMEFAVNQIAPRILEFCEEISIDDIILPMNDCNTCEDFAMNSEDEFSAFLVSRVLDTIRKEI